MLFFLKKFLQHAFLPPVLPLLLIAGGLMMIHRKKRYGKTLVITGLLISFFCSIPLTVDFMAEKLENVPVLRAEQLEKAQAIVILGGGQRGWAREYGHHMPNRNTLERLCYGASLAKKTALPILVTGGAIYTDISEAAVMQTALSELFGLKAAWVEQRSLDTHDNAVFSAEILKKEGVKSIVLVTHACHMWRSVNEFENTGLTVIPAPTAFFSDKTGSPPFFGLIPSVGSMYTGYFVIHEWVGLFVQKIRNQVL